MLAWELYIEKGWTEPIRLPEGKKYPPVEGFTGGIPKKSLSSIKKHWEGAEDSNLGLRAPSNVILFDVDHYESKEGRAFLAVLEKQLGTLDLENSPRSTRRDPRNPSGQWPFRVPAGMKWKGAACTDVDIIQHTHRYTAAWPSVVDGEQYKWYIGREEIEVPSVDELPELPEAWVRYLQKGKAKVQKKEVYSGTKAEQYEESMEWLSNEISGFDFDRMSQQLELMSDSEKFISELQANSHDSMVAAVHSCIMLGCEAHEGLEIALDNIRKHFLEEVTTREDTTRRGPAAAESEFQRAVTGEVQKLRRDLKNGLARIIKVDSEWVAPNFGSLIVESQNKRMAEGVDLRDYRDTDYGHALMLADYWRNRLIRIREEGEFSFALWNDFSRRFELLAKREMQPYVLPATADRIRIEAKKIFDSADSVSEKMQTEQLGPDDLDDEELRSQALNLVRRADGIESDSRMRAIINQLFSVPEGKEKGHMIKMSISEFDKSPYLIGLDPAASNGEVLDLREVAKDPFSGARLATERDFVTKSTNVIWDPGAQHPAWDRYLERHLPDLELRKFVRKCIGYSLIEGNPAKKIFFLKGPSDTGKSLLLEVVGKVLGDYAGTPNETKMLSDAGSGPNSEMLFNIGKRMVFFAELGDSRAVSSDAIKRLTGNDSGQFRHGHSTKIYQGAPSFTPYVSTNSAPEILGADQGTKGRFIILPFESVYRSNELVSPEDDLKRNEAIWPSVFRWIVEGYIDFVKEGLGEETWPDCVVSATHGFTEDISEFEQWKRACIEEVPGNRTDFEALAKSWDTWRAKQGMPTTGSNKFSRIMKKNGYSKSRTTRGGKNWDYIQDLKIK